MKILFDHQIFCLQERGGVSRYFVELFKHIPKEQWETTIFFSNNEYLDETPAIKHLEVLRGYNIKGKARILNELNKIYSINKILKNDFDIFHQTHFGTYSFPFLKKKKLVTTFHDMNFTRFNYSGLNEQIKAIKRADKIIAVSHNTKKEMLEQWDIPEEKIQVIYHGVDKPLDKKQVGERLIDNPYILYVGLREFHKNFKNLAYAFSKIKKIFTELKLVCTSKPFSKDEQSFLSELNILNDTIYVNASDVQLANLYSFAELFVYPSFHEGFGMPILEAMSYGCATIVSNTSCMPEIGGEGSFYFNPYDVEDISNQIIKLLSDASLRTSKVKKGYELCNEYTWEKCANEHIKVYESLM